MQLPLGLAGVFGYFWCRKDEEPRDTMRCFGSTGAYLPVMKKARNRTSARRHPASSSKRGRFRSVAAVTGPRKVLIVSLESTGPECRRPYRRAVPHGPCGAGPPLCRKVVMGVGFDWDGHEPGCGRAGGQIEPPVFHGW